MGTEALWIPAIAAVVSAGAQYADSRQQNKRRNNEAMRALQGNRERQARADQKVNEMLQELSQSDAQGEKESTLRGFMAQLDRAREGSLRGLDATPAASDAFRRDAAAAALGIADSGAEYADVTSRIMAPGLQRQREAISRANTGYDLALIGREQEGADRTTQTRMDAIRSNPWLQALSAAARGFGTAYGAGTMGGGGGFANSAAATPVAQGGNAVYSPWAYRIGTGIV